MADLSQKKGKTVWFVVHRKELLDQTFDTFKRFEIPLDTIHIGMVHSFANHPEKYPPPDLIVFDEGHFAQAATWRKIVTAHPKALLIGLTGSPARLDGKPLKDIYDTLIECITPQELIDMGYLSQYRYFAPAVADLAGLKRKGSDFDMADAEKMLSVKKIYGDVIKHYRDLADGKKAICYCSTIKHSKEMAEEFVQAGINAVHFDGETPKKQRDDIVKKFRIGEIQILCNVDLISMGFDCPDCECCILLRPTMSTALYIQQSMRALRPQPNKIAIILDHVGNYTRHGLPTDHREWSLDGKIKPMQEYGEDGAILVRQCTRCFYTFSGALRVCPNCGYENQYSRTEIQNIRNIELKEIEARQLEHKREAMQEKVKDVNSFNDCKTFAEMVAFCRKKGYKNGAAYVQAKKRGFLIR